MKSSKKARKKPLSDEVKAQRLVDKESAKRNKEVARQNKRAKN